MSTADDASYDNRHRALLQAFVARGSLTLADAKPIIAAIESAHEEREIPAQDIGAADLDNYIASINAAMSPYDMEIRSGCTQTEPRTRIFALINTLSDSITQLATTHSADEIAYVKRLLDEMFDKNNTPAREIMAVGGMQATRLHKAGAGSRASGVGAGADTDEQEATQAHSLSIPQAERMLQSLVDEGWFEHGSGYYTLSQRALMELRGWLLETYNEPADEDDEEGEGAVVRIKTCRACGEIVTIGQRCATRECLCRLHDHCTQSFFRAQRGTRCPLCKAEWTGRDFVGVRAVKDGTGSARSNHAGGSSSRRQTVPPHRQDGSVAEDSE